MTRGTTRIAVVLLAASVLACGGSATGSPGGSLLPATSTPPASAVASPMPSVSPPATTGPTESPAATPDAPSGKVTLTGPYPPDTAVRVTVNGLRMREEPGTGTKVLKTLDRGDVLVLGDWPWQVDGIVWYPALRVGRELPALPAGPDPAGDYGWVAVREAGADYVAPLAARCPETVDLEVIGGMLGTERLACFGDRTLELEGVAGCGGCGGVAVGTFKPAWLIYPLGGDPLSVDPNVRLGDLLLHYPPAGPDIPDAASIIRVRGHFDDAAAARCEVAVPTRGEKLHEVDSALVTAACRQEFVVESYEILGTDPDFPYG